MRNGMLPLKYITYTQENCFHVLTRGLRKGNNPQLPPNSTRLGCTLLPSTNGRLPWAMGTVRSSKVVTQVAKVVWFGLIAAY